MRHDVPVPEPEERPITALDILSDLIIGVSLGYLVIHLVFWIVRP